VDIKVNDTKPSTELGTLNTSSAEKQVESSASADVLNPIDSLLSNNNKEALPEKAELPVNDIFGGGGAMFGGPNPF